MTDDKIKQTLRTLYDHYIKEADNFWEQGDMQCAYVYYHKAHEAAVNLADLDLMTTTAIMIARSTELRGERDMEEGEITTYEWAILWACRACGYSYYRKDSSHYDTARNYLAAKIRRYLNDEESPMLVVERKTLADIKDIITQTDDIDAAVGMLDRCLNKEGE